MFTSVSAHYSRGFLRCLTCPLDLHLGGPAAKTTNDKQWGTATWGAVMGLLHFPSCKGSARSVRKHFFTFFCSRASTTSKPQHLAWKHRTNIVGTIADCSPSNFVNRLTENPGQYLFCGITTRRVAGKPHMDPTWYFYALSSLNSALRRDALGPVTKH
jgi:hypothetical protein